MSKPKFFFEADNLGQEYSLTSQEHADTFFSTLQTAGIIKDSPLENMEAKTVQADASMQKLENKLLQLEYGVYQENYAVHITPVHPQKNLKDNAQVNRALLELAFILKEFVPDSVHVDLFLPRKDFEMKVLSAVVRNGTKEWGFNIKEFEEKAIPKLFKAIEKVIMS